MEKTNGKKKLLLSVAIALLLFGLAFLLSPLRYETNDDATLSNILNGAFGENRQDLIYVNIVLSRGLRLLQSVLPGVNVLVLFQLFWVAASLAVLAWLLMEHLGLVRGALLAVLALFPFAVELIANFQYVKTSTIIICAGLLLIAVGPKQYKGAPLWGIGFVVIGCQIRFESFIAAGALSAFALLFYFVKKDRKEKQKTVCYMLVLFLLVFGFEAINGLYYAKNPQWQEFDAYNQARTDLSDYKENYIPLYTDALKDRGFSENDIQLLYQRNYYDNTVFTTDVIQRAADAVGMKSFAAVAADYLHIVRNLFLLWGERFYRLGFLLSLLLFVSGNRRCRWFLFGTLVMYAALLLYLMIVNRYMTRIEVMLLMALTVNMAVLYEPAQTRRLNLHTAVCAVVVAVLLYNLPVHIAYQRTKAAAYREESARYESVVLAMSADKENLYLFDPVQTDYFAGLDPMSPRPAEFFSNICPTGSWYANSVYTNGVLERFDMESPLLDSVNRTDVYISNEHLETKLKYVQEHLDERVYAVKVTDNGLCDYQLRMDD